MPQASLFSAIAAEPDLLGESPAYDSAGARLVWTDMMGHRVRELRWADGWAAGREWNIGELAAAVVPRASGGLVVLTRTGVLALSDDGVQDRIASLDQAVGVRFNDAKCDAKGRLVAGWMAERLDRPGAVVRIQPDGAIETLVQDVDLANGMTWSPDGSTFYLVDSVSRSLDAFDYVSTGMLRDRRRIATFEPGNGAPNGVSADDSGCLWVAMTYGGEVRCYSPDGDLLQVLETPARRVTSCAFGGPGGDELFVTSGSFRAPSHVSTRAGLDPGMVDAANSEVAAGALFVCRPGVTGPPAVPFAG